MTDQELKDLVASLALEHQKTEAAQQKTELAQQKTETSLNFLAEEHQKTEAAQQKTELAQQKTDRQLKELGKQIGGLGRKFGSFTEGMAFPSMQKLLQNRFHMEIISSNVHARKAGHHMELDVLAYANTEVNAVYIVEVKSHLREEHLAEFLHTLTHFSDFFPEIYAGKQVYGILAFVSGREPLKVRVRAEGLYLAHIHGDLFDLEDSPDFQARSF